MARMSAEDRYEEAAGHQFVGLLAGMGLMGPLGGTDALSNALMLMAGQTGDASVVRAGLRQQGVRLGVMFRTAALQGSINPSTGMYVVPPNVYDVLIGKAAPLAPQAGAAGASMGTILAGAAAGAAGGFLTAGPGGAVAGAIAGGAGAIVTGGSAPATPSVPSLPGIPGVPGVVPGLGSPPGTSADTDAATDTFIANAGESLLGMFGIEADF